MKKNVEKYLRRKGSLAENEVKDLLKIYGIKTTKYEVVNKIEDLERLELKFPVALKVCSSKILHKTDVNGVKLDIKDMEELKKVFKDFRTRFPGEKLLVDQMVDKGVEINSDSPTNYTLYRVDIFRTPGLGFTEGAVGLAIPREGIKFSIPESGTDFAIPETSNGSSMTPSAD